MAFNRLPETPGRLGRNPGADLGHGGEIRFFGRVTFPRRQLDRFEAQVCGIGDDPAERDGHCPVEGKLVVLLFGEVSFLS